MPASPRFRALWLLILLCGAGIARGEAPASPERYYVADITLQTDAEFLGLLERAEQLLLAGVPLPDAQARVAFVLHGPVIRSLLRENYLARKPVADLAARLSALQVIEVKACRRWMSSNGIAESDLLPFVDTVALGPDLIQELLDEHDYLYF